MTHKTYEEGGYRLYVICPDYYKAEKILKSITDLGYEAFQAIKYRHVVYAIVADQYQQDLLMELMEYDLEVDASISYPEISGEDKLDLLNDLVQKMVGQYRNDVHPQVTRKVREIEDEIFLNAGLEIRVTKIVYLIDELLCLLKQYYKHHPPKLLRDALDRYL